MNIKVSAYQNTYINNTLLSKGTYMTIINSEFKVIIFITSLTLAIAIFLMLRYPTFLALVLNIINIIIIALKSIYNITHQLINAH